MMKKLVMSLLAAILILGVFGNGALAASLTLKGSTTVLPIAQAAMEKYKALYPRYRIFYLWGRKRKWNQGVNRRNV